MSSGPPFEGEAVLRSLSEAEFMRASEESEQMTAAGNVGNGSDWTSGDGADSRIDRGSAATEGKERSSTTSATPFVGPMMLAGRVGGVQVPSSLGREGARLMSMTAPSRFSGPVSALEGSPGATAVDGDLLAFSSRLSTAVGDFEELIGLDCSLGEALRSTDLSRVVFWTDWRRPKLDKSAARAEPDLRRSVGGGLRADALNDLPLTTAGWLAAGSTSVEFRVAI